MSEQVKPKTNIWIVGVNVLVLLVYTLLMRIGSKGQDAGLSIVLGTAFCITVHIVICLVASVFIYRKELLLSALAVLLIGFSTCYMGMN